jgi:hypothetical protein
VSDIKISDMTPWVGAVTGNVEFPAVFANENYKIALSQLTTSTFGFGSMALQNSNAVNITGGNVAVTALSGAITIANGGTGLGATPTNGQLLIGTGSGYALATLTAGLGIDITNTSGGISISVDGGGVGSVTSVDVSGGSTGIIFSGGPVTTAGVITMSGTLGVANGGTGATTATTARANLSAAKSGANSDITSITGLTTPLSVLQGGTGANDSLSGYIFGNGTNPFTSVAAIPMSDLTGTLPVSKGGTNATTAAGARASLLPSYAGNAGRALFVNSGASDVEWAVVAGAGTVTSVDVSGGSTGLTTTGGPIITTGTITLDGTLVVANGGTGSTSATGARANLSAAKSGANSDITSITGLTTALTTTQGGTGLASYAAGDMVYYTGSTAFSKLTIGTSTQILTSNGSIPVWTSPASVTVGNATNAVSATSATTATNIAGGNAGSIPYQSGSGATTFLGAGTGVVYNSGGNPAYSMTPTLTSVTLTSGTVSTTPTSATDLVNKSYVDTQVSSGITFHTPVKYEVPSTTGNLTALYNQPGGAGVGVGATLTNNGTKAPFAPDGPTASIGDRILIYNQTNAFENGIYEVVTVGTADPGGTNWVLRRTTDADTYALKNPNGLGAGDAFFITAGDTGAGETYVMNTVGVITFGTTAITFVQVSDSTLYTAGNGLQLTSGTVFSLIAPVTTVNGGTGLTSFTSGGAVYASSTSALTTGTLPVTAGGSGATTLTGYLIGNGTSAFTASATIPATAISSGAALTRVDDTNVTLTLGGSPASALLAATSLTLGWTGQLAISRGGTNGTAAPAAGTVAYGTGTAYAFTSAGTTGQVLLSNNTSAPSWGGIDGGTF